MTSRSLLLLLFVGIAAGQTSGPGDVNKKPASVDGIVTNAITGEPLNHAHVSFQDSQQNSKGKYGAITSQDGRFSITSIPPDTYNVTVERRGYQQPPSNENSNGDRTIVLNPGEGTTNLVFKMIPLAILSGRVWDENNEPVEHVMVEAIRGKVVTSSQTNDRGEYRLFGLPSGRYLVRAAGWNSSGLPPEIRTDGTIESNYGTTYYPGATTREAASLVQVQGGAETRGIDIRMARVPILRVSGIVSGVPKTSQGVNVSLSAESSGSSQQSVHVDNDFRFTIWRLPPGTYYLQAQSADASSKIWRSARMNISLANSNVDNINLELMRPFDLTGSVDSRNIPVAESSESPRQHLQLRLGNFHFAEVGLDGTFRLTDLEPAPYRVSLTGLSIHEYIKSIQVGMKEYPGAILDLTTGPPRSPITIVLSEGSAEITGTVRDQEGRPTSGMVGLVPDDGFPYDYPETRYADSEGNYSFDGVAPGAYKVFAFNSSDYSILSSQDGLVLYEAAAQRIEVTETTKISQDLNLVDSDEP